MPFIVNSTLNPMIPKQAGVYVFPGRSKMFYVGKTTGPLQHHVKAYQRERIFRRIWWHVLEPAWVDTYEMLYIQALKPTLNRLYHVGPLNRLAYRGRLVKEQDLTWSERIEAHKAMIPAVEQLILGSA